MGELQEVPNLERRRGTLDRIRITLTDLKMAMSADKEDEDDWPVPFPNADPDYRDTTYLPELQIHLLLLEDVMHRDADILPVPFVAMIASLVRMAQRAMRDSRIPFRKDVEAGLQLWASHHLVGQNGSNLGQPSDWSPPNPEERHRTELQAEDTYINERITHQHGMISVEIYNELDEMQTKANRALDRKEPEEMRRTFLVLRHWRMGFRDRSRDGWVSGPLGRVYPVRHGREAQDPLHPLMMVWADAETMFLNKSTKMAPLRQKDIRTRTDATTKAVVQGHAKWMTDHGTNTREWRRK
jgi:hypothetical protein